MPVSFTAVEHDGHSSVVSLRVAQREETTLNWSEVKCLAHYSMVSTIIILRIPYLKSSPVTGHKQFCRCDFVPSCSPPRRCVTQSETETRNILNYLIITKRLSRIIILDSWTKKNISKVDLREETVETRQKWGEEVNCVIRYDFIIRNLKDLMRHLLTLERVIVDGWSRFPYARLKKSFWRCKRPLLNRWCAENNMSTFTRWSYPTTLSLPSPSLRGTLSRVFRDKLHQCRLFNRKKEPNVENISVFPLFSVCCRAAWVSFSKKFCLLFSPLRPSLFSAIVVINFNSSLFLFQQNTFCSSHTTPANAARPGRDDDDDDTAPLLVGEEFSSLHILSRSEASWDTETSNDSGEEWSKRKEMFSWKMVLIILFISLFNISHDQASRATL